MSGLSDILAFVGVVLSLPGLLLIALADRIDDAQTMRRLTREFDK